MSETKCECPARKALISFVEAVDQTDPPGYVYDEREAECCDCGEKAATIAEIKHRDGCFQDELDDARAALSAPCHCEGLREDTGHGEICYYCQKPCNGAAANPMKWPIPLCHPDEPGVPKWHHIGCVSERLAERDQLYATLCRKIEAYSDLWREREQLRAELAEAREANKTQRATPDESPILPSP